MPKAKFDPLEDAKVKPQADAPATDADASETLSDSPKAKAAEAVKAAPPPAKAEPKSDKAAPAAKRYRVLADCRVSYRGCMTIIRGGAEISAAQYGGDAGIAKLIRAGLKLEEVS